MVGEDMKDTTVAGHHLFVNAKMEKSALFF